MKKNFLKFFQTFVIIFFIMVSNFKIVLAKDVMVVGKTIGMVLKSKYPTVVDISYILDSKGEKNSPAKVAGIKKGDKIKKINDKEVFTKSDIIKILEKEGSNSLKINVNRNNKELNLNLKPHFCEETGKYKLGIWINDCCSGIGTITFYDPDNLKFASVGHAIIDETDKNDGGGEIYNSNIITIDKGTKGYPGELTGHFSIKNSRIGSVLKNCKSGVYGKIENEEFVNKFKSKLRKVAEKHEIRIGEAYILSNVFEDEIEKFSVKIEKIHDIRQAKDIDIKITDEKLIKQTGGIVKGMSGSPLLQMIQNESGVFEEKIVGAITHVTTNDPTRGHALLAKKMVKELESADF